MEHIERRPIPEKYLEQLREAGLFISHRIPAFRNGVYILKPITTIGNHIPGYGGAGYVSLDDDPNLMRGIEDRLCLMMDLFK